MTFTCKQCGIEFDRTRNLHQKNLFCSKSCKDLSCSSINKNIPYVSKIKTSKYINIFIPTHPKADKKGFVAEHRYVAECKLGRALFEGEIVHHIDNNPHNNVPENLMIFKDNKAHLKYHRLQDGVKNQWGTWRTSENG